MKYLYSSVHMPAHYKNWSMWCLKIQIFEPCELSLLELDRISVCYKRMGGGDLLGNRGNSGFICIPQFCAQKTRCRGLREWDAEKVLKRTDVLTGRSYKIHFQLLLWICHWEIFLGGCNLLMFPCELPSRGPQGVQRWHRIAMKISLEETQCSSLWSRWKCFFPSTFTAAWAWPTAHIHIWTFISV